MVTTINGRNEYIRDISDAIRVIKDFIDYDLGDYLESEITDYEHEIDCIYRMYEEEEKECKALRQELKRREVSS